MERVPKDVLRLLLTKYFEPKDAVKCYRNIPLFHNACEKETVITIKRRYFSQFYECEPFCMLQNHNYYVCVCGFQCKKHEKIKWYLKCELHQCRLLPNECPDCYRELITQDGIVLLDHMRRYCPAKKRPLKQERQLSTLQLCLLIYLGILLAQLFGILIKHLIIN